jgi:hypothetical protein
MPAAGTGIPEELCDERAAVSFSHAGRIVSA